MAEALNGRRVAFLATTGVEESELTEPWSAIQEAGADPSLISLEDGEIEAWNHFDKGQHFTVDDAVAKAKADDYAALVIPGGVANPDQMRTDSDAVEFVKAFFAQGKPVAVICHGPWMLAEADVIQGRSVTSWPSVRTDLLNAGATWKDEEVVVCTSGPNTLITSRKPDDLPAFCHALIDELGKST